MSEGGETIGLHQGTKLANNDTYIMILEPSNDSETRLLRRPQDCITQREHKEATAMNRVQLPK